MLTGNNPGISTFKGEERALRADRLELADLPEVAYQVTLRVDEVLSGRRPPRVS